MSFNKSTGCSEILNFNQIDTEICEKMDTYIFPQINVTLNEVKVIQTGKKCRA